MSTPLEAIEGKYEILEKLREGGMGAVYKVRHRLLEEIRVIKMMRPHLVDDEVLRARFVREAQTAIRLRHPGIAQLYDFTVDEEGNAFIVMEYIDGFTLQEALRPGLGVGLPMALEIARQTLDALAYLHRKKIIHRDISPDNLMLTRDEQGAVEVKLIDLGIAKVAEGRSHLTTTGTFLGKVRYSSPEHFGTPDGHGVEPRSDLYSFGVVLYELVTGRYPIRGSSTSGLIAGHLVHPPLEFEETDPGGAVPEAVRVLMLRALAKKAEDRFASAADFRAAVEELQQGFTLTPEEVNRAFELPTATTARIPVARPGSTQERLNRQFGLSATPPPPSTAPSTPAQTQQIRALLLGAERLAQDGHLDEARLQIAAVRELEPDNAEAARLVATIDASDRQLAKRRADAARDVRTLADAGDLQGAIDRLASAVEQLGNTDELTALRDEIEGLERTRRERRERFEELLARVAQLAADEQPGEALDALEAATELADSDEGRARIAVIEGDLRSQLEAQRRAHEVATAAARIRELLDGGELAEAARALTLAEKVYRSEGELIALRDEIESRLAEERAADAVALRAEAETLTRQARFDEALTCLERALQLLPDEQRTLILIDEVRVARQAHLEAEARRCETEVQDAIAAALALVQEADFDEALALLKGARETAAGRAALEAELAGVETDVQRRAEAHRLEHSIARAAASVEECIERGDLDEADRQLHVAERLYGDRPEHATLRHRLEELETAREVDRLVTRAFAPNTSFADAIARLEEALKLIPGNARLRQLLVETRAAHTRHRAERHRTAVATAVAEVCDLASAGDTTGARKRLERALRELGEFSEATELRTLIADAER